MKARSVLDVIEPIYVIEGAGVLLRRSMATQTLDYLDPFLLFDHFRSEIPKIIWLAFQCTPTGVLKQLPTCYMVRLTIKIVWATLEVLKRVMFSG